ncbi:MAG: valine--tRNA ligase [Alphaproteobacteria bacterium]|nr:valine--tRNA ligase [Alphaproteobacteria bacterium]
MTLAKTYSPKDFEAKHYAAWEDNRYFAAGRRNEGRPYTIVIPPPNVTGSLHMGHALNNTLQDVLIRFERMRGRDTLWQPGTDHAGIATQMVVERQLDAEGKRRTDMTREAFVARVWQWKEQSGGTILHQLKRLGASCDWERERFTMDQGLSRAVTTVFVELYKQGLIYKDSRLVNWDPKFLTAISDLEVEQRQVKGHLWHIRYPIEGSPGQFIVVATTRPETMLGDTAVAVHPEDERYRGLIGKQVVLPLVGRRIPVVADEYADPEHGSGAVKVTPGHDFNDFEVGRRHKLPIINIFDQHARLNEQVPGAYRGLDRFKARERILADLAALELLAQTENIEHAVPYGDRSGVVIEPWLTDQWYVDAKTLAQPAIRAVEQGEVVFVPRQWENTYFEWMRNIQPWCISRQLWWGHQIPAWYGPDGKVFVEMTEDAALTAAKLHYGRETSLTRDTDVLDTWFSSALWPFSTLGWPDKTPALARYYPTDTLVTGFDIIFFWIARMIMMGIHFMGEVPFRTVYVHALVRDEKGQKMSKSKGNIIDPLELSDEYGADALRFTLAAMAAQGRDIKLAKSRVEGYRNFATKLWNAARFLEMNVCLLQSAYDPRNCRHVLNRWVVGELARTGQAVTEAIQAYKFNEAAEAIYHFAWDAYCDWYLEFIKPLLAGGDGLEKEETRATAAWVLSQVLHLLHPFMPFVTEELWQTLKSASPIPETEDLAVRPWFNAAAIPIDGAATAEIDWVIRLISAVRAVRAEMNVPVAAKITMTLKGANQEATRRLVNHNDAIRRLARLAVADPGEDVPAGALQIVHDEALIVLPLAGVIDLVAERARLDKEVTKVRAEIAKIDQKLADEKFVARAPEHVVEEQRTRRADFTATEAKLLQALARVGAGPAK